MIQTEVGCPDANFTCENKRCIPKTMKCDGKDDCGDNTDENDDCCEFMCNNQKCVNSNVTCNGIDDCGDFSDEIDCKGTISKHIWYFA